MMTRPTLHPMRDEPLSPALSPEYRGEGEGRNPVRRWHAPAMWLLIGLVGLFAAGKVLRADSLDADLFWHLKVAQQLQNDGIGPLVDHLSYESIKTPWTPYSWLAELGMKWTWDHLGWRGAVAGDALMGMVLMLLIGGACAELAGKQRRLASVLGTIFGAFFVIPYVAFRPITLAMVMLAGIAWLLLRDRRQGERSRGVWLIIPLVIVLTNIHLCVVLVPLWIACLLIGAMYERRGRARYAILLVGISLACLMTPMLPGATQTAWFYQWHDVMVASGLILEMTPIYHNGVGGAVLCGLTAVLLAIMIWRRRRLRAGEWIWLGVGLLLMLRLAKFTPMFAFIGAPVLAATMPAPCDVILRKPIISAALGLAVCACLVQVALLFPPASMPMDQWLNREVPRHQGYPTAAADYVEQHMVPRSGRLINEFNWGGYLAWRLGNRFEVFVDGRTQLYPVSFWRATYLGNEDDLVKVLQTTGADAAIVPVRGSRFRAALVNRMHWRIVYRDNVAEMLMRD